MIHHNMTLLDSLNTFYMEEDQKALQILITSIQSVAALLTAITVYVRILRPSVPRSPPSDNWTAVGYYDLRRPQMLPKHERAAANLCDESSAVLYERIYSSGASAWRYTLDNGQTWFYPTRTSVIRRGMTEQHDTLIHE